MTDEQRMMPEVLLGAESQGDKGFEYELRCEWEDGRITEHLLLMSYADHERWCHGSVAASEVALKALRQVFVRWHPDGLPKKLDLAMLMRQCPDLRDWGVGPKFGG